MIIGGGHTWCPLHLLRCQASEDVIDGMVVKLPFQQLYALILRSPKGNFISSRKNVPTHQSGGVGDGLGPAVREGDLVGDDDDDDDGDGDDDDDQGGRPGRR